MALVTASTHIWRTALPRDQCLHRIRRKGSPRRRGQIGCSGTEDLEMSIDKEEGRKHRTMFVTGTTIATMMTTKNGLQFFDQMA